VEEDEESFVARLVAGLTAYPSYYAHMAGRNRAGPGAPDLSAPAPVDPAELRARVRAGEWVVDLRDRAAYAAAHLRGSIGIGLGQQFSTYLGWLVPWGTPVTLVGESPEQIAEAQRQLVRIGIERPAGAAVGRFGDLAAADGPRVRFDDLARARERGTVPPVLDVRRDDERGAGAVPGAAHVPLHSLLERLDDVPGERVWVHCASGYRAAIAASLLERAGRDVVLIDDEYARAVELGLASG
jgi:hydroxyacylglutathione hydrolase